MTGEKLVDQLYFLGILLQQLLEYRLEPFATTGAFADPLKGSFEMSIFTLVAFCSASAFQAENKKMVIITATVCNRVLFMVKSPLGLFLQ